MLTLQKTNGLEITSLSTADRNLEDSLSKEWLLTNKRGSYASSTIIGCNTRRYHGLLIGSLNPPVNRVLGLPNCLEMVVANDKVYDLATFEFNEKFTPQGFAHVKRFRRDIGVHFDYHLGSVELTKSVYLLLNSDTVALVYDFTHVKAPVEFVVRPFVSLRDFHSLQKSYAPLCASPLDEGLLVRHDIPESCELFLKSPDMHIEEDPQWWFNFLYRYDKQRGQDFNEDLWTPGFFKCCISSSTQIVLWAHLSKRYEPDFGRAEFNLEAARNDLLTHQKTLIADAKTKDKKLRKLCVAADQFVTKRKTDISCRTTVLAGFPWFADWGRDAFIALPGLLVSTGRFDEAKSVLATFARVVDDGMIPNRFDDRSSTVYFNSIDASLWFINAAFQYLDATGDSTTFTQKLLPTIRWIIDSYYKGTRFGTHADIDGLITAGNEETQLTWMDAKCDGVVFTPRHGKAVEINALWYNALCLVAQFYTNRDITVAEHYHDMADKVKNSFSRVFWNEEKGYLNDCISPESGVNSSLRPNQIFAVSLPFSPLSGEQQKAVVDIVQSKLLTPYGLRSLNTCDDNYKGIYAGPQQQRDQAYHQGTVWAFLIGAFVESFLKVHGSNRKTKKQAAEFIEPLLLHFCHESCLGSVSEIFDGDVPHLPKGCVAQAWSVAELIRAYQMVNN